MSVVDERELVHDRVGRIRHVYPRSTVVLLLDGDLREEAWPSGDGIVMRATGGALYALEGRGLVVHAHLEAFLETDARWWFKVDPDTVVRRRITALPDEPCFFGTLQGGEPAPSLQGGCIGGTREAAARLVESDILFAPELVDVGGTWGRGNPNVLARAQRGITSFDFVHAWACRRLGIPLRSHPEIRSEWKEPPAAAERYAITHPHKTLDEAAEREQDRDRRLVSRRVLALIDHVVPEGARVAVVSKGDERLTALRRQTGRHFPSDERGRWAGYHPADSDDAISLLEAERRRGSDYLVIPETAAWWLDYYGGLARHLSRTGRCVGRSEGAGTVWALNEGRQ